MGLAGAAPGTGNSNGFYAAGGSPTPHSPFNFPLFRRHLLIKFFGLSLVLGLLAILVTAEQSAGMPTEKTAKSSTAVQLTTTPDTGSSISTPSSDSNAADPAPAATGTSSTSNVSALSSNNDGQTSTRVTVNGQNIPVPRNGSTKTTVGSTSVTVTGSTQNDYSSSSDVNVQEDSSP